MSQERSAAKPERVQKVLAAAGLGSRRACEELIAQGRVAVDGERISLGAKADPERQVITVDGERVHTNPNLVYLLLNKPPGVVTTVSDPQGRPTVMDLVPTSPRVYPVGRLDRDTEGLLILTNDGELANRLAHPRFEVEKTYVAQVRGTVKRRAVRQLLEGVELEDGPARARSVRELGSANDRTLLEIVLAEGRKREVRRMLATVGIPLERLARVKIGPLPLGDIAPGKFRPLGGGEVRALYTAVGLGGPQPPAEASPAEPDDAAEPDMTDGAGVVAAPGAAVEPETVPEPGAAVEPETVPEPGATVEPETVAEPGAGAGPGTPAEPGAEGDATATGDGERRAS